MFSRSRANEISMQLPSSKTKIFTRMGKRSVRAAVLTNEQIRSVISRYPPKVTYRAALPDDGTVQSGSLLSHLAAILKLCGVPFGSGSPGGVRRIHFHQSMAYLLFYLRLI